MSPRAQARGLPGDAVPNEVRDASLSLGRTKEGDFFEQPQVSLE